ncbi:MAG: STAS domain-containing protein [Tepidisphaeraceae bacterium]
MADVIPQAQNLPFTLQPIGKVMVVEFKEPSLMDPIVLDATGKKLVALVDEEDRRLIIMDFEKVQYLSSQAIGILLTMKKKLDGLGNSKLVLCGIGSRLAELLKITRLDKVLTIKPTQKEALASFV